MKYPAILLCFSCFAVLGCCSSEKRVDSQRHSADYLIKQLDNSALEWNGSILGLLVTFAPSDQGEVALSLTKMGVDAIPDLIMALDDANKFAAAHVILTTITGCSSISVRGTWNGLNVHYYDNGRVEYEFSDSQILKKKWSEWVRTGRWDYEDDDSTEGVEGPEDGPGTARPKRGQEQ